MKKLWLILLACLCFGTASSCKDKGENESSSLGEGEEYSYSINSEECFSSVDETSSASKESTSEEDSSSIEEVHTHQWDNGTVTTPSTCETAGVKTFACACGESYTEEIPAIGHVYANDICTVCGDERVVSQGLEYALNEDGVSYAVTGIGTCEDIDLVIPSTYENLPVTSIDRYAFFDCNSLTSVEIPNSVTSIGNEAFIYCTSLTSVVIPDSVTSIGDGVFSACASLTSVKIPNSVTSIGCEVFSYCISLTDITVLENNSVYKSIDGNLYTKDGTTLIQYAIGKTDTSFTVPDSVTSIGEYAFAICSSLINVEIPDSVTEIGDFAFGECTSLTDIKIGASVTNIGMGAFAWCDLLTTITLSENNTAYQLIDDNLYTKGGETLVKYITGKTDTSFTVPDSVTRIENFAFHHCTSLVNVYVPDSVTSIGRSAFDGCSSLANVELPDTLTSIETNAFSNTLLTRDALERRDTDLYIGKYLISCWEVGEYAIKDGTVLIAGNALGVNLDSVVIPASIRTISKNAFMFCMDLTTVYYVGTESEWNAIAIGGGNDCLLNATVYYYNESQPTEAGNWWHYVDGEPTVFGGIPANQELKYTLNYGGVSYSVSGIGTCMYTDIVIPSTYKNLPVTSIGRYAFNECTSLTSVKIPNSVTSIGGYAFAWCNSLTSVEIPDSVTSIDDYAFWYCTSLTSIEIPDSVTMIDDSALSDCTSLTSVVIPDSVTSIGDGAFFSCGSLISVEIPNSVTSIGDWVFKGCMSLISIEIPDSVTSIGGQMFAYCRSLASVIIPNSVTSIGEWAFESCDSLTSIKIPDSVASIDDKAFMYCFNLTTVYYVGTESEWSAIAIGEENDYLLNATRYYYSESQPTEAGNWWHYVDGEPTAW